MRRAFLAVLAATTIAGCSPNESPMSPEKARSTSLSMLQERQQNILKLLTEMGHGAIAGKDTTGCTIVLTGKPKENIQASLQCISDRDTREFSLDSMSSGFFKTKIDNASIIGGAFDGTNACITIQNPEGTVSSCLKNEETLPRGTPIRGKNILV